MSIFTIFDQINKAQENIDYLDKKLEEEKQKQEDLLNQKISIRLSDFAGEVSSLSGVNILDMYIKLTTNIFVDAQRPDFTMEYAKKRQEGHNLEIQIFGHKTVRNVNATPFKFLLFFPLDFEKRQADEKTLLEHCTARRTKVTSYSLPQKEIVVDKNIGDIVCEFSVRQLMLQDSSLFSPKAMFLEAVNNCIKKGKVLDENNASSQTAPAQPPKTQQEEKTF